MTTETLSDLIAAYRLDETRQAVTAACTQTAAEHGTESPQHAAALLQLGRWHFAAGEYAAAEPLLKQALQYAQNHPTDFLHEAQQAQAALWNENGQTERVIELFAQNCTTAGEQIEYGIALSAQNSLNQALQQFETAAAALAQTHGIDSTQAALAYIRVAVLYRQQGHSKEALSILSGCLKNISSQQGEHHPYAAEALVEMAATCAELGNNEQASRYYDQAEEAVRKSLGNSHIKYGRILAKHAYFLAAQGKTGEALIRLQYALVIHINTFDENHPAVHALIRHTAILAIQQIHSETQS